MKVFSVVLALCFVALASSKPSPQFSFEQVANYFGNVQNKMHELADNAKELVKEVSGKMPEYTAEVQAKVNEMTEKVKQMVEDARNRIPTAEITAAVQAKVNEFKEVMEKLYEKLPSTEDIHNKANELTEKAKQLVADMSSKYNDAVVSMQNKMFEFADQTKELVKDVKAKMPGYAADVQNKAQELSEKVQQFVRDAKNKVPTTEIAAAIHSKVNELKEVMDKLYEQVPSSDEIRAKANEMMDKAKDLATKAMVFVKAKLQ